MASGLAEYTYGREMGECSASKTLCDTGGDRDELSSRTMLKGVESGAEHVVARGRCTRTSRAAIVCQGGISTVETYSTPSSVGVNVKTKL